MPNRRQNVVNSVREYTRVPTQEALDALRSAGPLLVVSSGENAEQQAAFAQKLEADFHVVDGSAHRSIIGYRDHAAKVEDAVRRFIRAR